MAVISLLKKIKVQDSIFENHPCSKLPNKDKLNYIRGLALIANEDGDISSHEIEYLNTLVRSFHLSNEHVKGVLKGIQNPTQKMLQEIVSSITSHELEYYFILDAFAIAKADGDFDDDEKALIKQYESIFELEKKEKKDLAKFSKYLLNKNEKKLLQLFEESAFLNIQKFKYLFEYHNIVIKKNIMPSFDQEIFNFKFEEPLIRRGCLKNASHLLIDPINNLQYVTFLNTMLEKGLITLDKRNNIITTKSKRILLSRKNKDIYFKNNMFKIQKSCEFKRVVYVTFSGAFMFIEWINNIMHKNYRLTELQSDKYNNLSIDDLNKYFHGNELFIKDGKYSKRNTSNLIGLSSCSSVSFEYNAATSSFRFMY